MPRATWPLHRGRPKIEIFLNAISTGNSTSRNLLADSGAGAMLAPFEMIVNEKDCLSCGGLLLTTVTLGGAYTGPFPLYSIRVQIPALGFDDDLDVVGVPATITGFDGLAGFRFLNRFNYGNFGDPNQFGLEM